MYSTVLLSRQCILGIEAESPRLGRVVRLQDWQCEDERPVTTTPDDDWLTRPPAYYFFITRPPLPVMQHCQNIYVQYLGRFGKYCFRERMDMVSSDDNVSPSTLSFSISMSECLVRPSRFPGSPSFSLPCENQIKILVSSLVAGSVYGRVTSQCRRGRRDRPAIFLQLVSVTSVASALIFQQNGRYLWTSAGLI
jgi:hypothetical protein